MSWASDYLVKRAMEKSAKRWFWRLAELPEERRKAALEKFLEGIKRFGDPNTVTWGELAKLNRNVGLGQFDQPLTRFSQEQRDKLKKKLGNGFAERFGIPPADTAKRRHIEARLAEIRGEKTKFREPGDHLERALKATKEKPILLSSLPVKPKEYMYRGQPELKKLLTSEPNTFYSGYPFVSAGYAMQGNDHEGFLLKAKTPKGAVFTPHVAAIETEKRLERKRSRVNFGRSNEGRLPYYETVVEKLNPRHVKRIYKLRNPAISPSLAKAEAELVPFRFDFAASKPMRLAQKAWSWPVMKGLLKGFKP